jgi:hypothetical protein
MKPKIYTPELVEQLVQQYQSGTPVQTLAQQHELPLRSVIAKLSQLGVYERKGYRTKNGEVPVPKRELIERLGVLLDEELEMLDSLEKVNKRILKKLISRLESTNFPLVDCSGNN